MSAVMSDCARYRYRLDRDVDNLALDPVDAPVLFIGINPSTADADHDDATIRKMTGFVRRWGFTRFMVANVFPYRATNVKALRKLDAPTAMGSDNYTHLRGMLDECGFVVPCWGQMDKVPKHLTFQMTRMLAILMFVKKPVLTFGLNHDGSPKHPLMLSYETKLQVWTL